MRHTSSVAGKTFGDLMHHPIFSLRDCNKLLDCFQGVCLGFHGCSVVLEETMTLLHETKALTENVSAESYLASFRKTAKTSAFSGRYSLTFPVACVT